MKPIDETSALRWRRLFGFDKSPVLTNGISSDQILVELNTDYSTRGLTATEIVAVVQAWQAGALSRDSMLDIFRRGEVLPEGRSNQEEISLIQNAQPTPRSANTT